MELREADLCGWHLLWLMELDTGSAAHCGTSPGDGGGAGAGIYCLGQQRGKKKNPGGLEMRLGAAGFVPLRLSVPRTVPVSQSISPLLDLYWFIMAMVRCFQQLQAWSAPALCGESA